VREGWQQLTVALQIPGSARNSNDPEAYGYRNVVLGFLFLAYTLNFVDRSIIGIIGQSVKVDLLLSDAQLGLLGGLAFALLYTSVGIPIARIAERANRVNLISVSILVWSCCTALCGFAQNFLQLLIFRAGVGIGEAGLSPAAHSLISDYFEPWRRASALAIYALGIPVGAMVGAIAGGWIAQELSWRWALMLVGLPGVLVAFAFRAFIREPRRDREDQGDLPPTRISLHYESAELWAVARTLMGRWPTLNMILGVTVVSFADYGIGTFAAPYFIRQFGLDLATVGLIIGVVGGVSTGAGTLLGGVVSDWVSRRTLAAYGIIPAIGITTAAPMFMLAYTQDDWRWAAILLFLPGICSYLYLGPCFGVIQNVVEARRRATATALLLFVVNLIGLGAGPPFVGWLIDQLSSSSFDDLRSLGALQAATAAFSIPADGSFASICPGGVAPAGAVPGHVEACMHASAHGTRQVILLTLLLYFWSALHFFLASIGLERMLREAQPVSAKI
jgi:MFS family permease